MTPSTPSPDPAGLRSLVATRREEIAALARHHRITGVRIFGSVARGNHGIDSDIDFLVDLADDASLVDIAAFRRELRELLGVEIDVVSSRALLSSDDDIVKDAVAL